jgi:hypothetical protein
MYACMHACSPSQFSEDCMLIALQQHPTSPSWMKRVGNRTTAPPHSRLAKSCGIYPYNLSVLGIWKAQSRTDYSLLILSNLDLRTIPLRPPRLLRRKTTPTLWRTWPSEARRRPFRTRRRARMRLSSKVADSFRLYKNLFQTHLWQQN